MHPMYQKEIRLFNNNYLFNILFNILFKMYLQAI